MAVQKPLILDQYGRPMQLGSGDHIAADKILVADIDNNFTSNPKTVENIVKDLFLGASNVKMNVVSGITGKGGTANTSMTGPQLKDAILAIPTSGVTPQGDATEYDVVSPKTFMNFEGVLKTGNIPEYVGIQNATEVSSVTGCITLKGEPGRYKGLPSTPGISGLQATDVNFEPANIITGKTIFGMVGAAAVPNFAAGYISGNASLATLTVTVSSLTWRPKVVYVHMSWQSAASSFARFFMSAIDETRSGGGISSFQNDHWTRGTLSTSTGSITPAAYGSSDFSAARNHYIVITDTGFTLVMPRISATYTYQIYWKVYSA